MTGAPVQSATQTCLLRSEVPLGLEERGQGWVRQGVRPGRTGHHQRLCKLRRVLSRVTFATCGADPDLFWPSPPIVHCNPGRPPPTLVAVLARPQTEASEQLVGAAEPAREQIFKDSPPSPPTATTHGPVAASCVRPHPGSRLLRTSSFSEAVRGLSMAPPTKAKTPRGKRVADGVADKGAKKAKTDGDGEILAPIGEWIQMGGRSSATSMGTSG